MTLPVMIAEHRKKTTVAQLQKFYTTMNQALRRSEADNDEFKYWESGFDMGAEKYFDKYWKPYLKVLKICTRYSDCGYTTASPFTQPNGKGYDVQVVAAGVRTTFKLADGATIINFTGMGTNNEGEFAETELILVDLNGGKAPNRLGRDVFCFTRNLKGIINPYLMDDEKKIQNSCNKVTGTACAAKIMADGWEIKDDYPW